MQSQGGKTTGFLPIAVEEKELTIVHVAATIDVASLQEMVKSTLPTIFLRLERKRADINQKELQEGIRPGH
jgi:hypothetical protein